MASQSQNIPFFTYDCHIRSDQPRSPNRFCSGALGPQGSLYVPSLCGLRSFSRWAYRSSGVDDELIAPENPGPGRWTGRNGANEDDEPEEVEEEDEHTDPEDLSFDSDEVSYRDESSEYSASDSDSDDGGWDSEASGSEVGSVEALEIFENTVACKIIYMFQ